MFVGTSDNYVQLFNVDKQEEICRFNCESKPSYIAVSDDGSLMACGQANG